MGLAVLAGLRAVHDRLDSGGRKASSCSSQPQSPYPTRYKSYELFEDDQVSASALHEMWSSCLEVFKQDKHADRAALAAAKESLQACVPLFLTRQHWDSWLQPGVPREQHQVRLFMYVRVVMVHTYVVALVVCIVGALK